MFRVSSLIALLALVFFASVSQIKAQNTPVIESIEARLFNSRTGEFSADVLKENTPLGNVIAGEYSSVSTFIKVKLKFPSAIHDPNTKIRLVAKENNSMHFSVDGPKQGTATILDRSTGIGALNSDGSVYVGFWLDNTGCKAIELTFSATFNKNESIKIITLPFACYE